MVVRFNGTGTLPHRPHALSFPKKGDGRELERTSSRYCLTSFCLNLVVRSRKKERREIYSPACLTNHYPTTVKVQPRDLTEIITTYCACLVISLSSPRRVQ